MKIITKYTNFTSTPALDQYIEDKIGALEKYISKLVEKGVAEARVEVARTTKHHQKGDVYHVECNLQMPGKLLRGETEVSDVRVGIDEVKATMDLEIKKYMGRVRPQDSGGQKELRKLRGKE
ncbi:MAG: Uncharacterized protein G01um10143_41 [Parcubacteria group bacterium Gr01-1014_3]|nr:MAG: Uncharacterized protein G01um10143_41 [Parcubacteria group bacterium Gr01-1014_3]